VGEEDAFHGVIAAQNGRIHEDAEGPQGEGAGGCKCVGMPNADCTPNHIRYSVTVDIPNPALFDQVRERFGEHGWKINVTTIHASDE
jgi:hypothetical protein